MKTNLSSSNIPAYEKQTSHTSDNKSISPSSSPRSSPRPSPKPQTKRDHSKSDIHLNVNYKQQNSTHDGSPSSQDSSSRERLSISGSTNNIEITPPQSQDFKSDSTNSSKEKERRDGKGKKKSSWFNSTFYSTYKSKSEDLKRLFKEVPDDERLVVDYACALQKEILHQGRIYVTQNYLCFYANIFGWERNLTLKWKDVASITKEKTALVIPNAILISTKGEKFFFASFVSRDKTYLMLFRVWQNALMDQPMSPQEMWQWVHQCYGSELGLTSDDEDYIPPPATEEDKLSVRLSVESFSEQEGQGILDNVMEQSMGSYENRGDIDEMKISTFTMHKRTNSDSRNPTDATDNSESEADKPIKKNFSFSFLKEAFTKDAPPHTPPTPDSDGPHPNLDNFISSGKAQCTCPHVGRKVLDEVFPIHVDQLFTLLFTSSKFYLDFHAARKTTDLTQTPWTHNPIDNSKSRVVNLTMALLATMGPKTAQCTESQTMNPCSKAGELYSIDVESLNAGVPYADSFYVCVHFCLQKVSETHSSIVMYAQVKYKKSVWSLVKGMIERNCYAGIEDYAAHLARALRAEADDEGIPESKKRSRARKRRIHCNPKSSEENSPVKIKNTESIFSSEICTMIVFTVLLLLLVLNVMLYYKLWSLEDTSPYNMLDLHLLKNPPKSHEEWIQLLQQQETLHTVEAQKWQKMLKNSIELLRQAEHSLNELQNSIQNTYSSKLASILQQQQNRDEAKRDL